jgi:hypothetical protein
MQTEAQRRNIETAIIAGAKTYTTSQGVAIPTAVVLAVARKP